MDHKRRKLVVTISSNDLFRIDEFSSRNDDISLYFLAIASAAAFDTAHTISYRSRLSIIQLEKSGLRSLKRDVDALFAEIPI